MFDVHMNAVEMREVYGKGLVSTYQAPCRALGLVKCRAVW